jgi:hypothetical protein
LGAEYVRVGVDGNAYAFMFKSDHDSCLRRCNKWFQRPDSLINVLCVGEVPTLSDAVRRLRYLEENGPSDELFGLSQLLSPRRH